MRRTRPIAVAAALWALSANVPAMAVDQTPAVPSAAAPPAPVVQPPAAEAPPASPAVIALKARITDRHIDATAEERQAAAAFYEARAGDPVFAGPAGLTPRGQAVLGALKAADDFGLPAGELVPSQLAADASSLDPDQLADTEARLALVQGIVTILASGLALLGVEAPDEMR